ncbi:hypothetical protein [Clostridium autoethanogenum]|uniref:Uncharacterized protein n=1 Tax=Clostridium autoethanogenum DSM 10061 TaxID=1341692 RepID=A0ABN4BLQ1_9CLOT|nr:hypothetical protein [Clostridium autoethanogenum]AGY78206.1 hypothetical protein CAETHG_4005 [Clostridium autoethanogenum DSM 10061]ALU38338.1 Hypothetical protein CLAU_3911 [Clostridium autoethanogenum DSM 10061]OVY51101.1 hypothetical protein WX72_02263 [Clostridium autoethanogenum]
MRSKDKKSYILKRSNGAIWNISYNENREIVYRIFKEDALHTYNLITSNISQNLSAILLPNDIIYVLYQDMNGNINLLTEDETRWNEQQIIKNNRGKMNDVYFQAFLNQNEIHIIYSVLNKKAGITTIWHQILDKKNDLSSSKIIDTLKFNYDIAFSLHTSKDKKIFILYQKSLNNRHELGYKIFNHESKNWSNFYSIDSSTFPYKYYSILKSKNTIHILYIKNSQNRNSLIYASGIGTDFKYNKLSQSVNIDFCYFFIGYNQIWCSWTQDNKIYSSFSIDGGRSFSNAPFKNSLTFLDITKCIYSSNKQSYLDTFYFNELYMINKNPLEYLIISQIFPNINDYKVNPYMTYFMDEIWKKISAYQKMLNQKNNLILQLKYLLKQEKTKYLSYKSRCYNINEEYDNFNKTKDLLNENINFIQKSLIEKENKINELENATIEKEDAIINLKLQLKAVISQLNLYKSKANSSLLKKIFKNDKI